MFNESKNMKTTFLTRTTINPFEISAEFYCGVTLYLRHCNSLSNTLEPFKDILQ